jgi:polar amino acid transport system substrate-binding protein
VGFNRRFAPMVRQAREFLREGQESAPLTATFRVAAGSLPEDHWTHDLEQGGGRLIGEGCHFVDTLVYLAGSPVVEVHAMGHGRATAPIQARDNVVVNLTFENGSVGTVAYVADGSPRVAKERLEAFCGSRTAVLNDYKELELLGDRGSDKESARSQDKGHRAELAAFVEGARAGAYPVPLEEVENVSLATIAIVESLRTGRPVSVEVPG